MSSPPKSERPSISTSVDTSSWDSKRCVSWELTPLSTFFSKKNTSHRIELPAAAGPSIVATRAQALHLVPAFGDFSFSFQASRTQHAVRRFGEGFRTTLVFLFVSHHFRFPSLRCSHEMQPPCQMVRLPPCGLTTQIVLYQELPCYGRLRAW